MDSEAFFLTGQKRGVNKFSKIKARSSGGERYLDTVEVVGSNPIVPTSNIQEVMVHTVTSFLLSATILLPLVSKMVFSSLQAAS